MDINDWRGISTILVMLAFFGICWWAFSPKRRTRFEEDAQLPFADEEQHQHAQQHTGRKPDPGTEKGSTAGGKDRPAE